MTLVVLAERLLTKVGVTLLALVAVPLAVILRPISAHGGNTHAGG